jgi:hypothetical protein
MRLITYLTRTSRNSLAIFVRDLSTPIKRHLPLDPSAESRKPLGTFLAILGLIFKIITKYFLNLIYILELKSKKMDTLVK